MSDGSEHLRSLEAAILASGDVVYDWNLIDDRITWGGRADALFGANAALGTGKAFKARIHPEDLQDHTKAMAQHFSARQAFDCEYRVRNADGGIVWVHDRGAAEFVGGQPVRMIGSLRAITARKQREAELEHLANYDQLTGHFNRSRLRAALEHALVSSARYGVAGAYFAVGLDRLGSINDAFGSETADAIIRGVGLRLDRCLRAADVVGRLGGDRFGVVLSRCPVGSMASTAEKILSAVRDEPFDTPNGPIHAAVSIGGVPFSDGSLTAYDVMARGDSVLQLAKQSGRNCFVAFSETDETREVRRRSLAIAEEVQGALKSDRLVFAFQPVVEAATFAVDHYECLMRLRREDGSLVPAGAFVPVVEQSGLMRLVDRHALELVVRELGLHPDVKLALNISGLTATDRSWLRALVALVKNRPDIAQRLIVEITETVALQDIEETARFVATVRDLGCRVALDDFGAGYTSFRHLKSLAVDCVKIDGSFVRGLADNIDNQLFIRTLLGLADGFGLATVAECVETAADATHLTRRGVGYLQGYFFGRPTVERPWLTQKRPRLALIRGSGGNPVTQPRG